MEVQGACVHGHNVPRRATVYGGKGLTGVHKRVEFRGGRGVQGRRQRGTKHSSRWYEARVQDPEVPTAGQSNQVGGVRSRLH